MIVNTARFVISNSDYSKCPKEKRHEYAFIGRSNVGKSSLINMLTGKKNLAMTSSTPGKTMLINHFLVDVVVVYSRLARLWLCQGGQGGAGKLAVDD